jgi:hypothetical protein
VAVPAGANVAAIQYGSQMDVGIRWPATTGRLIGAETRRIDVAITGAGITMAPTASITFPETQAELAAPAGPDRYFRFTEFDANGNLVKQSYVSIGAISAAGSANTGGAMAQYGSFYLDDEYFADNSTAGTAASLPTDGSLSQLQVLDNFANIDLSAAGPKYDSSDWYYFDVPNGPRQYVTVRMTGIEQFVAAAVYLSFSVDYSEPTIPAMAPVTFGSMAVGGAPTGADDLKIDGVSQDPSTGGLFEDISTTFPGGHPGEQVLEALLPQGRYFVRVCFVDNIDGLSGLSDPSSAPSTLGYRLSVQFSAPASTGGITG